MFSPGEALALITFTIALDKVSSGETAPSTRKLFTTKSAFKHQAEIPTETQKFSKSSHKSGVKNIIKVYKIQSFPKKNEV